MSESEEALYGKLRPGPGRSPAEVSAHQRRRIHGAMIEIVGEDGYGAVTMRRLTRAAGVSTSTFYEHFDGKEECFLETYDLVMRRIARRMTATQRRTGEDWRERFRVGVETLVWTLAGEPKTARLCLVEVFAAGEAGLGRLRHASATLDSVMRDALSAAPHAEAVPPLLIKGIVAGVMRAVRASLLAGREQELPGLADGLVEWALSCCGEPPVGTRPCERSERSGDRSGYELEAGTEIGDERLRILRATVRLAACEGYEGLTAPQISAAAGVSVSAFRRRFDHVDECFLAAAELLLSRVLAGSLRRGAPGRSWGGRVFRAVAALCEQIAREPHLARVALLDPLATGAEGVRRREHFIELGSEWLRRSAPPGSRPNGLDAEASLGAVWSLINHRLFTGQAAELPQQAAELAFLILAPAVGPGLAEEAIRAEAEAAVAS